MKTSAFISGAFLLILLLNFSVYVTTRTSRVLGLFESHESLGFIETVGLISGIYTLWAGLRSEVSYSTNDLMYELRKVLNNVNKIHSEIGGISDKLDITNDQIMEIFENFTTRFDSVDYHLNGIRGDIKITNELLVDLYKNVTVRFDETHSEIQKVGREFRVWTQSFPELLDRGLKFNELQRYIRHINVMYQRFRDFQNHSKHVGNHTLHNFAMEVLYYNSVENLMHSLHSMVNPHHLSRKKRSPQGPSTSAKIHGLNSPSIFVLLERHLMTMDACKLNTLPQQNILGLYSLIALSEFRGFIMVNFAYSILTLQGKGNFDFEQSLIMEKYMSMVLLTSAYAKASIVKVPTMMSLCYPEQHKEYETYVRFTELLQGIVEDEQNLNEYGHCQMRVKNNIWHAKYYRNFGYSSRYNGKDCHGDLYNCRILQQTSRSHAEVCLSSSTARRYHSVEYGGTVYGNRTSCSETGTVVSTHQNHANDCDPYFCLCDDPNSSTSQRRVSLDATETNMEEGMVVTGIRINQEKGVLVLQALQGKAIPNGQIDSNTLNWIREPNSNDASRYHTLNYDSRTMYLDNLEAPTGYVITGVRFNLKDNTNLYLQIRVTPISFETGFLSPESSYWIDNSSSIHRKTYLQEPVDPTKKKITSERISENKSIKFRETDKNADASQLTVPYFDARPVLTSPHSWITGLNLHHKGGHGSGGFVSFGIDSYNLNKFFEIPKPSIEANDTLNFDYIYAY